MAKFMVLYLIPPAVVADWRSRPETERKDAEEKMRGDWVAWTSRHAGAIGETGVGGKTKRVDASGTADAQNAITLYAFVEAASHAEATQMFADHPHLQIPQASIEVMDVRPMGGM